jgi:type VI protein secretion system component Hcp
LAERRGGADIKGSVDVQDRESSIEVVAQEHNLYIPTDNNTGKLTGTRIHTPSCSPKIDPPAHIFIRL